MSLASFTQAVAYGNTTIEYQLTFSDRKTLGISVHPDLSVTVTAPVGSDLNAVAEKVKKRAPWILRQQRDFERYLPGLPPRRYVSGETHWYLGKRYRLKLEQSETDYEVVKMQRGRIVVVVRDSSNRDQIGRLLDAWYRKQAVRVFHARLDECYRRVEPFGVPYPDIALRVMKTRWGSCTSKGKVILNPKVVLAPKDCIDYVVMHELCHLQHHDHSPTFFQLLDTVMPDWQARKRKLDELRLT